MISRWICSYDSDVDKSLLGQEKGPLWDLGLIEGVPCPSSLSQTGNYAQGVDRRPPCLVRRAVFTMSVLDRRRLHFFCLLGLLALPEIWAFFGSVHWSSFYLFTPILSSLHFCPPLPFPFLLLFFIFLYPFSFLFFFVLFSIFKKKSCLLK